MNRSLILLCLFSLLWSCSSEKPLEFKQLTILASQLDACNNKACPNIAVDYPAVVLTPGGSNVINELIENHLGNLISSAVLPENELLNAVAPAIDAFVLGFQDYMGDFPKAVMEYDLDVDSYVSYTADSFFTVTTNFYIFTGGAHGYGGTQFLNIDSQTEQVLTLKDIINDSKGFKAFAEEKFRTYFEIPAQANINSTGFWFENDQFVLPETFGFTQEGFELIYNTYEISSYVEGPQRLVISLEDMEPWLNSQAAL